MKAQAITHLQKAGLVYYNITVMASCFLLISCIARPKEGGGGWLSKETIKILISTYVEH